MKNLLRTLAFLLAVLSPQIGSAVGSAELYTSKAYGYGRFEARLRFAAGDGVVSSFFLWKDGSEQTGAFWNELDFEKLGADCHVQSNPIYGNPSTNHTQQHALQADLCGAYHTYAYEWTPDAIVWLVDGAEIRRETGATASAFSQNASTAGMQFHFNVWPGDSTFGGNFNPAILPVHQYIDWVQFSSYQAGAFTLAWREDFTAGKLPDGWLTGSWASPKNHSTHAPENVNFISGYAVLSLTADGALGPAGAMPGGPGGAGAGGAGSNTAGASAGGAGNAAGASAGGTTSGAGASAGGAPGSGGSIATGGAPGAFGGNAAGGAAASSSSSGSPSSSSAGRTSVATAGAAPSAGSPSTGSPSTDPSSSCSLGHSRGGALSSAIALCAMALLSRRSRRLKRQCAAAGGGKRRNACQKRAAA